MKNKIPIICVAFFLFYFNSFSQDLKIFDLAVNEPGTEITIDVEPSTAFSVKVIHCIPTIDYSLNSIKIIYGIKPLDVEIIWVKEKKNRYDNCSSIIKKLNTSFKNIKNLEKEKDVQKAIIDMKDAIEKYENSSCDTTNNDTINDVIMDSKKLINNTEKDLNKIYRLNIGEKLTVTIERTDGKKWTVIYDAGQRGQWITSYGFAFASNMFLQSRIFGIRQVSQDSSITIISQKSRSEGDFAPAIFFSWIPASQMNSNWSFSPCGGIGFDLKKPVILGGLSITYNWNLSAVFGVLFRWDKRTSDQFVEFQSIKPTEVDNLNRETVVFNPFIALSYRFGSNPFVKDSESKKDK